jgi:hypothetical protein
VGDRRRSERNTGGPGEIQGNLVEEQKDLERYREMQERCRKVQGDSRSYKGNLSKQPLIFDFHT